MKIKKKKIDRRIRKSRKSSKPTSPLNQLRGVIGEIKDWGKIKQALEAVKHDAPIGKYAEYFAYANASRIIGIALSSTRLVKKLSRIQSVTPLSTKSLLSEIAWSSIVISQNSKLINDFISLRDEYNLTLTRGHYEAAEKCLDEVDEKCGKSLWSLENKIALKTLAHGFEEQKKYVAEILGKEKGSFSAFYASVIGERNEARVSRDNYAARLIERANSWGIKSDQKAYIFHKLIGTDKNLTPIKAADILSYEAASSPIDLYETFIEILTVIKNQINENSIDVYNIIRSRLGNIKDHCISAVESLYSNVIIKNVNQENYLEAFFKGNYEISVSLIEDKLKKYPDDPLAVLIAAKLSVFGYKINIIENEFIEQIINTIKLYLEQDKESNDAVQALEKFELNFRTLPLSAVINALINHTSINFIGAIPRIAAVRTRYPNVTTALRLINEKSRQDLIQDRNLQNAAWQYAMVEQFGECDTCSLSTEAEALAKFYYYRNHNNYTNALEQLLKLDVSGIQYLVQESSVLKTWVSYENGNLFESIKQCIKIAVNKITLLRILPLTKIIEPRGFRDLKQMASELSLPISFYLYSHVTRENTKDVVLKISWKQLLKHYGISRPSEIRNSLENFEKDEIIFFLRYVCVQEIMELSSSFDSPTDLDYERLQICILLSEMDAHNGHQYSNEIIELTRRLSIEDGVQQVESSRIYVDLMSFQRWCHKEYNGLFLRYLDYAGAGLEASSDDLERSIVEIFKRSGYELELINFLDSYDVSSDSLLAELIEEISNKFMTLPRFGLDAYLGSRVRHGSLEGAFRNPLEKRNLITKKESSSNQYESNDYWLKSIENHNQIYNSLNKVLNTFSNNVDTILDTAITKSIYVRTIENPDGLITLWPENKIVRRKLLKSWVLLAKSNLTHGDSIEQFVENCATKYFWPALKNSLNEAAEFITTILAGKIQNELDILNDSVTKIDLNLTGLLATIKTAKEDVYQSAAKVEKWFALPQFTNVGTSYSLKTAIEIGLKSLRHLRPQFEPNIEWSVDEKANVILHFAAYQIINDVAFLIFGNIYNHSGFFDTTSTTKIPSLKINLSWMDPNIIQVEVVSDIHKSQDIAQINQNVKNAKEQIRLGQFDSVARKKSKTGLVRLASTLNYENSKDKTIDFGVVNHCFFVKFSVPIYFLTGQSK